MEAGSVSEALPLARSPIREAGSADGPLRNPEAAAVAPLCVVDLSHLTKIHLQAPASGSLAGTLGVDIGRCVRREDGALISSAAPGEWMVISPARPAQVMTELRAAAGNEFATIVDVTHARALVRLEGAHGADVLAKICSVDLSERGTPRGSALRTSVATVTTDVLVPPLEDGAATASQHLLHVDRSLGQYFFDCLLDAGREFAITVRRERPTEG
jgi:heterotetrameric sarcosine oxidase gamma subunit